MRVPSSLISFCTGLFVVWGATGSAAEPAAAPQMTREAMMKRAAEVSRGYYQALIEGKFETAASFVHPAMMERIRGRLVEELDAARPAAKQATFQALGVADLQSLRALPHGKFFAVYAQSQYGVGLRALSGDDIAALRPVVEDQSCFPAKGFCAVTLRLKGKKRDETPIAAVNQVIVYPHQGRWLVADRPPDV